MDTKKLFEVDEREQKTEVRSIRLTPGELKEIEKAAKSLGMSVNRYMRGTMLSQSRAINEKGGKRG